MYPSIGRCLKAAGKKINTKEEANSRSQSHTHGNYLRQEKPPFFLTTILRSIPVQNLSNYVAVLDHQIVVVTKGPPLPCVKCGKKPDPGESRHVLRLTVRTPDDAQHVVLMFDRLDCHTNSFANRVEVSACPSHLQTLQNLAESTRTGVSIPFISGVLGRIENACGICGYELNQDPEVRLSILIVSTADGTHLLNREDLWLCHDCRKFIIPLVGKSGSRLRHIK